MQEKDFGLILVMYPHTGFEKYCGDLMVVIAVYKLYNWSKKVVSLLFDSDTKLSDKEMHSRYEKFLKDSKLQAELSEIRVELSKYNCLIEPLDDFDDDEINQVDKPKNTQFVLDNLSQFIHRFEIHQIPQNLDAFTLFSQWTFKYMKNMIGIATEIDGLFMSRSLAEKFHLLNTANSIKTLSRGSISCYFKMIDQGKINPGGDLNKMEILSMTNRIKGSKKSTVTGSEFYQCCLCLAEVSRVFPTDGYGMRIINKGSKCFTCHRLGFHLNTFSWNVDCPSTNQCVYPVIDCLYRLWINRFQKRSSLISTVCIDCFSCLLMKIRVTGILNRCLKRFARWRTIMHGIGDAKYQALYLLKL